MNRSKTLLTAIALVGFALTATGAKKKTAVQQEQPKDPKGLSSVLRQ